MVINAELGKTKTILVLASLAPLLLAARPPKPDLTSIDRGLGLQTTLPENAGTAASPEPIAIPSWLIETLFYGGLVVGVIVLALAIYDSIPQGLARRARWKEKIVTARPGLPGANRQEVRQTADDMARAGRFADAMHLLLLTSLNDLRQRLDLKFADSLTSREILQRVVLAAGGKAAFASLVGAVEVVHFGARSAAASDYEICRGYYDRLSLALNEASRA